MNTEKTELIKKLSSIASEMERLDKRRKNRGRPKIGFKDDANLVSKMRQRGHKLKIIHRVLKDGGLTPYNNYSTFHQAWVRHLAD